MIGKITLPINFKPNILITADLHLHERKEFGVMQGEISSRLAEGLDIIKQIASIVEQYDIAEVLILGDIFELKDRIPNHVLVAFAEAMYRIKCPITVLMGNHDFRIRRYSSLKLYSLGEIIRLVDRPEILEVGDIKVGCLPFFREYSDFEFMWEKLHKESFDLFCFHQAIPGVTYKSKSQIPGTFRGTIHQETAYLAGHIHQNCMVGNIMYVGSPYQVNFNEVGEKKFVWLMDSTDLKIHGIELNYPKFKVVNICESFAENLKGNYIKLIGEITPDQKLMVPEAKTQILNAGAKGVITDIRYMREVKRRLNTTATKTDIIRDFVTQASKAIVKHLDKPRLIELGETLLQEARML